MARDDSPLRMTTELLSVCARHAVQAVGGLLIVSLVVRTLGPEGLGAWALLGTTSFLVGLSELGLGTAVQRAAARGEPESTYRLVRLSLLVVLVASPCLALIAWVLLLHLPAEVGAFQAQLVHAALPALAAGVVGSLGSPLRALLLMRGAFNPLAWTRAVGLIVQVALTAAGLVLFPSLLVPAWSLFAGSVLEALLLVRAARQYDPGLVFRPRLPRDIAELRDALEQGMGALAINVAVVAALRADVLILSAALPLSTVAAYQVASRAVDQLFSLAKQSSTWLMHRLGDERGRAGAVRLGTAVLGGLVTSGIVALVLDGSALLGAWVGPLAREPALLVALALLGVAAILAASEELPSAALMVGSSSAWTAARPMLAGHALNVALSLAAVGSLGVWGVAGGTVCGNVLIALLIWRKARVLLGWGAADIAWTLAPIGAAGVVSVGVGWLLAPFAASALLASVFSCGVVTLLGTGAALLTWWSRGPSLTAPPPEKDPACTSSS